MPASRYTQQVAGATTDGATRRSARITSHTTRVRRRKIAIVDLTPAAAAKASELLAKSDTPTGALRVRVANGGCSGMRYELLFDGDIGERDDLCEIRGLRVVVDAESARYLEGSTVDYSDDLNGAGFKVDNPKASATCGCGESFDVV